MKPRLHLYTRLNLPFILQLLMKMKTRGQLLLPTTDPSCCSINQDWNLKDQNFWLNIFKLSTKQDRVRSSACPPKKTLWEHLAQMIAEQLDRARTCCGRFTGRTLEDSEFREFMQHFSFSYCEVQNCLSSSKASVSCKPKKLVLIRTN